MQVPYSYNTQEDGSYVFTTNYGVEYIVAFYDAQSHFPQNPSRIFEFSFYPKELKGERDVRVFHTIIFIIESFLLRNSMYGLTFVCDNTDGKHYCRYRLFDIWFNNSNNDRFIKFNGEINSNDEIYLNSLITSKDNPHLDKLAVDYKNALNSLNKQVNLTT